MQIIEMSQEIYNGMEVYPGDEDSSPVRAYGIK